MMVTYHHGRKILRVPVIPLIALLIEQRDSYKAEVLMLQNALEEATAQLREIKATVLARHRADAELAELYREAAIQRAERAVRDPTLPLQ